MTPHPRCTAAQVLDAVVLQGLRRLLLPINPVAVHRSGRWGAAAPAPPAAQKHLSPHWPISALIT
jgi:hypothetical protein